MLLAWIEYDEERRIKIRFKNRYGIKIKLSSPSPFEFYSLNGEPLYSPVAPQVLVEVGVDEECVWEFKFKEMGFSSDIFDALVVRMSISEPKDDIYTIIFLKND